MKSRLVKKKATEKINEKKSKSSGLPLAVLRGKDLKSAVRKETLKQISQKHEGLQESTVQKLDNSQCVYNLPKCTVN